MPVIQVEFYGVPKLKAGIASTQVEANTVAELLEQLKQVVPSFADACLKDDQLATDYLLNINGKSFTRDASTQLSAGDHVLILSADVGG
ncbi:MoaD/ThiS family protein [bacterium]|jgi:molybdopterin converting factor small subunit|nr:MoaD/ThiS family protein [Planctomicrobium sp.]MDB4793165.1 MoaD/ThiS family protein [bacterium]